MIGLDVGDKIYFLAEIFNHLVDRKAVDSHARERKAAFIEQAHGRQSVGAHYIYVVLHVGAAYVLCKRKAHISIVHCRIAVKNLVCLKKRASRFKACRISRGLFQRKPQLAYVLLAHGGKLLCAVEGLVEMLDEQVVLVG